MSKRAPGMPSKAARPRVAQKDSTINLRELAINTVITLVPDWLSAPCWLPMPFRFPQFHFQVNLHFYCRGPSALACSALL
jgi:hypothetical protein